MVGCSGCSGFRGLFVGHTVGYTETGWGIWRLLTLHVQNADPRRSRLQGGRADPKRAVVGATLASEDVATTPRRP
eukprot:358346-Chlamydomonas_euryale.AAC.5